MNQLPLVQYLPAERLRTSYRPLRAGKIGIVEECDLKPLPLRVIGNDDGNFEIIDGFKRFTAWMEERRETVPVIIESPGSRAEHKRRLLQANAPHRTLTPMDEGRVVDSLLTEDGMTATAIAKLLSQFRNRVMVVAIINCRVDGLPSPSSISPIPLSTNPRYSVFIRSLRR